MHTGTHGNCFSLCDHGVYTECSNLKYKVVVSAVGHIDAIARIQIPHHTHPLPLRRASHCNGNPRSHVQELFAAAHVSRHQHLRLQAKNTVATGIPLLSQTAS